MSQSIFGYHNISCFNVGRWASCSVLQPKGGFGIPLLGQLGWLGWLTRLVWTLLTSWSWLQLFRWLVDWKINLGIQKMRKNFMIQKSMTRKPFLEFSHTEAKSLDIFLCAVACLLKQSKLDRVWEVYQNSSNNLVTEWYKFSQEILLSLYTVICFLKAKMQA